MRLRCLHMENFRQHRNTTVEFDSGLTGIIGPNGAGKSTILEAIAWAIYGNPAARSTRDGIRFQRAEPRAPVLVELDFELGGHLFRIARGLTTAELFLDGGSTPIASSISGVAEVVHRRLGMTRSEFFNTYFTGQKELNVMATMKPTERAQFLSRVLGYERLRTAQEFVRDSRKSMTAELAGLRTGMRDEDGVERALHESRDALALAERRLEDSEKQRQQAEENLVSLNPRWEHAQQARDRLQEVLAELRVAESEDAAANRDAERLDRELTDVASARAELDNLVEVLRPLAAIQADARTLANLAQQDGRRRTLQDSVRVLEDEATRLRERYARVENAPGLEEGVTEEVEAARARMRDLEGLLEARRTEWVRDRQEAETRRRALRTQYGELRTQREKLVALGDMGDCPTCMRPLGESYRTVLEMLHSQMETVRVDGNYFKSRLEQLEEMPPDVSSLDDQRRQLLQEVGNLERRLTQVQLAVHEKLQLAREVTGKEERLTAQREEIAAIPAGYDPTIHEAVKAELDRLTPLQSRATHLGALLEKESRLREERAAVHATVSVLTERVSDLRRRRDAIDFREAEFVALRTAHEYAAAQLHQSEVAAAGAQAELAAAENALAVAERDSQEMLQARQKLEALQLQRRMHDELDRAFSDLRTDLNFQLRPELSELASTFLKDITDGRYSELELDDAYRIVVIEDGVPKPVISGGEEDMANLSLRLAISQMIAERSGQSFSLLVLDEIFGSLDETHRRGVVELLRRVRDRFEQVILITHVEGVKEGLDRVIEVSYDEDSGAAVVDQTGDQASQAYGDGGERVLGRVLASRVAASSGESREHGGNGRG